MSSLDGQDIFGSGPHAFRPGSWHRSLERRSFAGTNGELVLDMGLRSRTILQDGRLQDVTATALNTLVSNIEAFIDGELHTLADNHGIVYGRVLLESFEPTTAVQRGRSFWCEYNLLYRQLP